MMLRGSMDQDVRNKHCNQKGLKILFPVVLIIAISVIGCAVASVRAADERATNAARYYR